MKILIRTIGFRIDPLTEEKLRLLSEAHQQSAGALLRHMINRDFELSFPLPSNPTGNTQQSTKGETYAVHQA